MNPGLMASGSPAQVGGIEQHPQQTSSGLKPYLLKLKKKDTIYIIHAFIYIQVTYQISMIKPSLKQRFKFVKPLYNHNLVTALLDKSHL